MIYKIICLNLLNINTGQFYVNYSETSRNQSRMVVSYRTNGKYFQNLSLVNCRVKASDDKIIIIKVCNIHMELRDREISGLGYPGGSLTHNLKMKLQK